MVYFFLIFNTLVKNIEFSIIQQDNQIPSISNVTSQAVHKTDLKFDRNAIEIKNNFLKENFNSFKKKIFDNENQIQSLDRIQKMNALKSLLSGIDWKNDFFNSYSDFIIYEVHDLYYSNRFYKFLQDFLPNASDLTADSIQNPTKSELDEIKHILKLLTLKKKSFELINEMDNLKTQISLIDENFPNINELKSSAFKNSYIKLKRKLKIKKNEFIFLLKSFGDSF